MVQQKGTKILAVLVLGSTLVGCSDGSDDRKCAAAAAKALQTCVSSVNTAQRECYADGDSACEDSNPDILQAHQTLEDSLASSCGDGEFLELSADALAARLGNACQSESDSIAWRTFGGPQGAVWPAASDEERSCLQAAHESVSQYVNDSLAEINNCLADGNCDTAAMEASLEGLAADAGNTIAGACPALQELIAVDAPTYIERAADQVQCMTATAHENTGTLDLNCGPGNVDVMPARGEWSQIILDGEKWGTMCGDGTEFAILMRPAPEGYPLDRVLVALEGGGVCLFEGIEDCRPKFESAPHLFSALDNEPIGDGAGAGIASDNPDNPFANWTKVDIPYCNQDVFIGGGVDQQFGELGELTVPRYGAVNLRAGMRVARDIIWKYMDQEGDTGFRPDELIALFGGFSAGGNGTLYNYHWVLDDLQWPRTAAFPDAPSQLDNGSLVGVGSLGDVAIPAWGAMPYLPPYCFEGSCAVGTNIYRSISPRLLQVPEQQYLVLSNQKDDTQRATSFFGEDEALFVNTMRTAYCDTKDLPGIHWYLTGESKESFHVVSIRDTFYYGDVAGERMVDWFERVVTNPESITDWAGEGEFVSAIPGVEPFPCELP